MRLWPRRKVYIDNLPKTHDLRYAVIFIVGLVAVFGALYGVGYAVAGNKLPSGTKVAEVDVGGMSPDQARTVLQTRLEPRLERPIKATVAGETFTIDPQRAGLTFDIDATLAAALHGSAWDPRHMMHVLTGGDDLEPVVDVDNDALAAKLRHIAAKVERKPVDSTVSFRTGQPEVTYGRAGRSLDYQHSGDRLVEALVAGDTKVGLVTASVQPRVTGIQATTFVDDVARRAVDGSVRIKVADSAMTLKPVTFGRALVAVSRDDGLHLDVDQARLAERARPIMRRLPHHPHNATFRFVGDRPVVVPATSGMTVAPPDLAKAVLQAVQHRGDDRVARAKVTPDNPRVSTTDLRMLRVKERVASAKVSFDVKGRDPRTALRRLDGTLIRPDGLVSMLHTVSDPASPEATLVASLMYDASFRAGLDIPEHTSARIYSSDFAPGLDADLDPPATDLIVRNTTPYGVYVRAWADVPSGKKARIGVAHVELWSTSYWKVRSSTSPRYDVVRPEVIVNTKKSCIPRDGIPGFSVDVTRVITGGGHRRSDHSHATYASLDQVRCRR